MDAMAIGARDAAISLLNRHVPGDGYCWPRRHYDGELGVERHYQPCARSCSLHLMERAKRGMIDLSVTEFSDRRLNAKYPSPPRARDAYYPRLEDLVQRRQSTIRGVCALPKPVRLGVKEAILGLFPVDGYLLVTPRLARDV
jgi:hypothetical protein